MKLTIYKANRYFWVILSVLIFSLILSAATLIVVANSLKSADRKSELGPSLTRYENRSEYIEQMSSTDLNVRVGLVQTDTIALDGLTPISSLPRFATLDEDEVIVSPKKSDYGNYMVRMIDIPNRQLVNLIISAANTPKDMNILKQSLLSKLGSAKDNYGFIIKDLKTGELIEHNQDKAFPPASISKLPSVILALRDIDSGKYTFDTKVVVQDKYKHTDYDNIAKIPAGSTVTIRSLIYEAITVSNNTAHYHLHYVLLGGRGVVDKRSRDELGVTKFYLAPHEANVTSVAKVMEDLYYGNTLKPATRNYLINLLKGAVLKSAIAAGVPKTPSTSVANKEGFLFGGREGNVYADSAIVFGKYTDYLIVILNNKAPAYPNGAIMLRELSRIAYNFMDKP